LLSSVAGGDGGRRLCREGGGSSRVRSLCGIWPSTRVTDEAALDLDQQELNAVLSEDRIGTGFILYSQGGHAGSYARLTLTNIALQDDGDVLWAGTTTIAGNSSFSESIIGTLKENVTLSLASRHVNVLEVLYPVQNTRTDDHGECHVGGLNAIARANRDGCT
jgi:hypothetical protein